jgi:hypothetical protein
MGKSKIPLWFIHNIEDEHQMWLFQKVWERLPAYDRAVLRALVLDVNITDNPRLGVLGSASAIDCCSIDNGNAGDMAIQDQHSVFIDKNMLIDKPDRVCLFVIAHEFAHVVLRHVQMSLPIGFLIDFEGQPYYTDNDMKPIRLLHEDEAGLLAWVWGFDKEMRSFLKEYPESYKPRWFVDITSEPDSRYPDPQ